MKTFFFLLFTLSSLSFLHAEHSLFPFFMPPKEWKISDTSLFKDGVKVGFVDTKKKQFPPSLTLSLEHVKETPLKTYIEAVKKSYEKELKMRYRELGYLSTNLGDAHLSQIDVSKPWGEVKILQAILIKDEYALIQTGVCQKEDLIESYETFLTSFKSLDCNNHFLDSIKDSPEKQRLENKIADLSDSYKEKDWLDFASYVQEDFKDKGLCWQFLALQTIKEELIKCAHS